QIYLESGLFFSGVRPAMNVGLSVSRVGGAAQTTAIKQTAGSLRIDLARFRELEIFTQFSSDLDSSTQDTLAYGKQLIEILKQPLGAPLSVSHQAVILYAATHRLAQGVPLAQINRFMRGLAASLEATDPAVMNSTQETGALSEAAKAAIEAASLRFEKQVSTQWQA
ncbi:MAG: F0F1 ATP synthase subunit alpha, partial [Oscillospiraceae bacterium]